MKFPPPVAASGIVRGFHFTHTDNVRREGRRQARKRWSYEGGLLRLNPIRAAGGFCKGVVGGAIVGISSVWPSSIGTTGRPEITVESIISLLVGESG